MNSAQRYNFDKIREQINQELLNKNMPEQLYESTNKIIQVINAIVKTKGEGWTAQLINNEGKHILSQEEQQQFEIAFKPYLDTIIEYFSNSEKQGGGDYKPDIPKISNLSKGFIDKKIKQVTHTNKDKPTEMFGIDDMYSKVLDRISNINSTVDTFASKYGILKLEKEHDLEEDIRLVPEAAAAGISQGLFALTAIPPNITMEVLSKMKAPFRTLVFTVYLILDIARVAISVSGIPIGRKILSILVSLIDILRGDWKKSVLSFIGFFGTTPLLIGQLVKIYLSLFRMLAPQIQQNIIFGSLDAAKSFIIGLCLAIFQTTAPEEVRLPLIGILEKIAQKKAEIDGTLEDIGLSARPNYLAPTFDDLNNIQALMSDKAFICSCEFEQLVEAVNKTPVINFVLQILRIPVNKEFREYTCGVEPCKDFVTSIVKDAKEHTEESEKLSEPISIQNLEMPISTANEIKNTPSVSGLPDVSGLEDASKLTDVSGLTDVSKLASASRLPNVSKLADPTKLVSATKLADATGLQDVSKLASTSGLTDAIKSKNILKGGRILHSRHKKSIV